MTQTRSTSARRHQLASTVALLALPLVVACDGRATAPRQRVDTPVQVSAALTGSAVEWVSVEVTASDIPVPVVVTLPATGTTARGTITVPSGAARTFTARGYDTEGTLTHRATATVNVVPGTAATVPLVLLPATDGSAATYREDRVTLSTSAVSLAPGSTQRLTATVRDANGAPVTNAAITWATLDPAIVTVSRTGLITAITPGTTQVVVMSGGGAAVANVVVQ